MQDAERRHRDAARAGGEQQQRPGGDNPGAEQQRGGQQIGMAEGALRGPLEPDQVADRRRAEQQRLEREALERARAQRSCAAGRRRRTSASVSAIQGSAPYERSASSTPAGRTPPPALRRAAGAPAGTAPQQHVDQRVDEVAQAGLDDVAVVHRPDIDEPVDGEQQCRSRRRPAACAGARSAGRSVEPAAARGDQRQRDATSAPQATRWARSPMVVGCAAPSSRSADSPHMPRTRPPRRASLGSLVLFFRPLGQC